jgi:hypothetical protein
MALAGCVQVSGCVPGSAPEPLTRLALLGGAGTDDLGLLAAEGFLQA